MDDRKSVLRKWELFKVVCRAFFIQNLWSFERMQAYGFLYCLLPVIKRLYTDREGRASACRRHLEAFNTHPYLASFILGVSIAREESHARGDEPDVSQVPSVKSSMMGPIAGVGDNLFWVSLRPFLALLGVSVVLLNWDAPQYGLLGPMVFLALYNLLHLYVRWVCMVGGYRGDIKVVERLRSLNHLRIVRALRVTSYLLVGAVAALKVGTVGAGGRGLPKAALAFALMVSIAAASRIKATPAKMMALVSLLCLAGGYLGWVASF